MSKNKYNLFTTIGMIVGIVIGSGIFFKSDNILIATNGSISLGVIIFFIAAIGIIFGGLSIAELASRSNNSGGIIGYIEEYTDNSIACATGWFLSFLYYPTLLSVVSWVAVIYFCQLFNVELSLEYQIILSIIILALDFAINYLSSKLGGIIQNISTVIKILPLFFIAILGLILGDSSTIAPSDIVTTKSFGWLTAIAPVAFAFDGWIVSTSISDEIENPKKNLPIALIIAPISILLIYIAYFVGISMYVGPENIIAIGDAHVAYAANNLLGNLGSKIILIFVIISVLGTLNGIALGSIRMPNILAKKNMIPYANTYSTNSKKYGLSIHSTILSFALTILWTIIHYLSVKFDLLPNSDVSEIAVIFSYIVYIVLYIQVIKLAFRGSIQGFFRGKFNPIMGIIGSTVVLLGSLSNPIIFLYFAIFLILVTSAIIFYKYKN